MSFFAKVGSFAKSTGGAPAAQAISGLGWTPQAGQFALILWTSGGSVDGTIQTQATLDARGCLGIASGTAAADQYAAGFEADTAGGGGRRITQKAIVLTNLTGALLAEASLTSLDADGYTLTWSTNNAEAQIVHYLVLGGTEVQAKVLSFTSPAGAGNFATTGAGFPPNLLISIGSLTAGSLDTGASQTGLRIGAGTSASSRWAASALSNQAVSSQGWRFHRNDRFVLQVGSAGATNAEMDIVSLDSDGFTLNQITVSGTIKVGVLCLKLPGAAVGTFTKPTGGAPAAGSVAGLTFVPIAALLASDQDINRANASSQTGARLGISALTQAAAESSVFSIPDAPSPLTFAYLEKTAKAAVKVNNATPAIDAECTGVLDGGGFTLTWNGNDAVATEYGYVAMGFVPLPKGTGRVTQRRHSTSRSRLPRGAWRRRAA